MGSRRRRRGLWLTVGACTVGLLALAAVGRAWADLQAQTGGLVLTMAPRDNSSTLTVPDLGTLTRMADVVVVGRVAGDGTTRLLDQPVITPIPFQPVAPPPGLPPEKATALPPAAPPTRAAPSSAPPSAASGPRIPITAYPI